MHLNLYQFEYQGDRNLERERGTVNELCKLVVSLEELKHSVKWNLSFDDVRLEPRTVMVIERSTHLLHTYMLS